MSKLDLDRIRLRGHAPDTPSRPSRSRPRRTRQQGRFLKGPVPWAWLEAAMRLPGRAVHVALHLRLMQGITKNAEVAVSMSRIARECGFGRVTASRGLVALERAGLVAIDQRPGCKPRITIIEIPAVTEAAAAE